MKDRAQTFPHLWLLIAQDRERALPVTFVRVLDLIDAIQKRGGVCRALDASVLPRFL
jgi:hypothetical protein